MNKQWRVPLALAAVLALGLVALRGLTGAEARAADAPTHAAHAAHQVHTAHAAGHAAGHAAPAGAVADAAGAPVVTMYRSPTCGCCGEWAEYLREHGFQVVEKQEGFDLMQLKASHGIAPQLQSCHTSLVGGYVLEGHVPADVLKQLLSERPDIRGLSVPGMPPGVPGMPPAGPNRAPYPVVALQHDGGTHLYATR